MNDMLKPYPDYRHADMPWLKTIPTSWSILRAKHVFEIVDIRSETGDEELLSVSANDGVVPRRQKTVTMFKAASYVGHKLCWPGDLVVNSLWAWMQGLGVARNHGLVSSAYSVYRPRPRFIAYAKYFNYALRSPAYKWELMTRSKGVWLSRLQLLDSAFLDMPVLIPPVDDQAAISRFLDHADGQIRRYIRAKRKLIALLNEQKQAIIRRAVTRGLEPTASLKPSGVEWFGDIPEHWERTPLRWCMRISSGEFIRPEQLNWESSEGVSCPVVGGNGILGYTTGHNSEGPTVVIGRVGALCGNVHFIDGRAWITDNALRITRIQGFNARFLALQLRALNLNRFANASAQPLITGSMIKSQVLVKPPIDEQCAIVTEVSGRTRLLDELVERVAKEVSLLGEYGSRLVADVVTGALDVREAANTLPEESEGEAAGTEAEDLIEDGDIDVAAGEPEDEDPAA